MSGAGHMLYAIKTLKANRELLKKRTLRNKKDYKRKVERKKLIFKTATPEQMIATKRKIKTYKQEEFRITMIALIVTILILFLLFWTMKP
ncbi:hypothetical protein [Cellulophaga sp. Hel_I_12]|uniref:hypothetical protein n=1 Tax=Cellulophaga sp. Hel_I_12 TaxID=1249972 RepID=UPI000646008C|nr:hypothetical protein [Cellulophaga sp. Hel_I_12]